MRDVVGAVIYDNTKGGFLVGLRHNERYNGWEFIGGKVEKGETLKEALRREIMEEIECDSFVGAPIVVTEINTIRLHTFFTTIKGEPKVTVHKELRWVKTEELENLDWLEADIPTVEYLLKKFKE